MQFAGDVVKDSSGESLELFGVAELKWRLLNALEEERAKHSSIVVSIS